MYFTPQKQIGLHVAAYYNYATNKGEVLSYSIDGLNNWGIDGGSCLLMEVCSFKCFYVVYGEREAVVMTPPVFCFIGFVV